MINAADPAKEAQRRWKAKELLLLPSLISAMNETNEPGSSYLNQIAEEREEDGAERLSETRNEDR